MSENNEGRFSEDKPPFNETREVDYDLMYDGMSQEEIDAYNESVYTPYELDRLRAFETIIKQAREMENRLKNGAPLDMNWVTKDKNDKTISTKKMWSDSWGMVWEMKNTAFHLYAGHDIEVNGEVKHVPGFIDSEKLKEAAEWVINGLREDDANSAMFETLECEAMWKAGED